MYFLELLGYFNVFLSFYGLVLESITAGITNANAHMAQASYGIAGRGGDCGIQAKCLSKQYMSRGQTEPIGW